MPNTDEERKRAYAQVQADLQRLGVFQVYLFGDGTVELSTEWDTDGAALGKDLYAAVRQIERDGAAIAEDEG